MVTRPRVLFDVLSGAVEEGGFGLDGAVPFSLFLTRTILIEADLCVQEHTWYEDYPLSFEDRPHILERHNPKGKPTKQTFYIVRFLRCSLSPLRSSTDSSLPCRTTPLVSDSF
jgi:hypothetical protein